MLEQHIVDLVSIVIVPLRFRTLMYYSHTALEWPEENGASNDTLNKKAQLNKMAFYPEICFFIKMVQSKCPGYKLKLQFYSTFV